MNRTSSISTVAQNNIRRVKPLSGRIAVGGSSPQSPDGSAYPSAANFDSEQAQAILGDLAEAVRKYLADKQKCRPPGLQTISEGANVIRVVADNPEVGVGLEVRVGLLVGKKATTPPLTPPAAVKAPTGSGLQVGPPAAPTGAPVVPPGAPVVPPVTPALPPGAGAAIPPAGGGLQVGPPVI